MSNLPPGVTDKTIEDAYLTEDQLDAICKFHEITPEDYDVKSWEDQQDLQRKYFESLYCEPADFTGATPGDR